MIWVESNGFVLIQFKVVSILSNHQLKLISNGIAVKEKLKSFINHHPKINLPFLKTVSFMASDWLASDWLRLNNRIKPVYIIWTFTVLFVNTLLIKWLWKQSARVMWPLSNSLEHSWTRKFLIFERFVICFIRFLTCKTLRKDFELLSTWIYTTSIWILLFLNQNNNF